MHQHLKDHPSHACSGETCGANLPMTKNIGDEFSWAKEGMEGLINNNLVIRDVTYKISDTKLKTR